MTLTLFRFSGLTARLWAFAMMGAARPAMSRIPGLTFWKLCGAGSGEGFTPKLDMGVVGILCVWRDEDAARAAMGETGIFGLYRRRAVESWTIRMATSSARGAWSGRPPFGVETQALPGPIAVLTRATLSPRALPAFWRRVPNVSAAIGRDPGVIWKIGLGEVPFLHQITFSIWPDAQSMTAFARGGTAHAEAVRAVRQGGWFREELYARFAVLGDEGTWEGRRPLAGLTERQAA